MNKTSKGIDWAMVKSRLHRSQLALERALAPNPERIQAIFRERAAQLAGRRVGTQVRTGELRVLTFTVRKEHYGVEFADVMELLTFGRCTPVPGAPAALVGVINVHGEIRSVVDLGRLLELPGTETAAGGYVLSLRHRGREAALRVDGVEAIRMVATDEMVATGRGEGEAGPTYLRGIAPDRLRILDTGALFAHPFFEASAAG